MVCPRCGTSSVRPVSEVETRTSGGYDICEGLCCGSIGAVLLGPIGWLFALCGINGERTVTTTKTLWVCDGCGNKWR